MKIHRRVKSGMQNNPKSRDSSGASYTESLTEEDPGVPAYATPGMQKGKGSIFKLYDLFICMSIFEIPASIGKYMLINANSQYSFGSSTSVVLSLPNSVSL